MNAGRETDDALTEANRAAGLLVGMVVRKRLRRDLLEAAAGLLERAASRLREVLSS